MNTKGRILTGDRPTGRLHLGHYVGTLANRMRLHASRDYEMFLLIADMHGLTRDASRDQVTKLRAHTRELLLDYLAVGIDPARATIYIQSEVPEVAELTLLFSMLITVPRLERVPTLKEVMRDEHIEQPSFGLLGYPVLQAADILLVKANLVPVGKDQESHVEVTREIARRFNMLYGEVFSEPQALVGEVLPGADGNVKMGKSLGNAIYLADEAHIVEAKVMSMYTDPTRIHADDPGHVEGNPVFVYHDAFNPDRAEVAELKARYAAGEVGDVEVKRKLARALNAFLEPIRLRRAEYAARPQLLDDILTAGAGRARPIAQATLDEVRAAMGFAARASTHAMVTPQVTRAASMFC